MAPRRYLTRTRAAVALTTAVALLSFWIGVLNIADLRVAGPLGRYLPAWVEQTAGFTGALTGFLLLA
ncbi:MAG: potassium channel protein, partial [Haloarculaceae archaeon]